MWGGRFSGTIDERMARFNNSYPFDCRMWDEDIRGSLAWARQIHAAGVITAAELAELTRGLEAVRAEFAAGQLRRAASRRGHPQRGRAAAGRAGRRGGGQAAHRPQPQRPGGDRRAAVDAWRDRAGRRGAARAASRAAGPGRSGRRGADARLHPSPARPADPAGALAAGALLAAPARPRAAGRTARRARRCCRWARARWPARRWTIDRAALAADLGFASVSPNSLDAVSDRDFVAEFLFCAALIGVHLSRLAEDMVLYSTASLAL